MNDERQNLVLDISWEALAKVLAFVVGIWAIVVLREVLILLFAVFIFVAAASPAIVRWQKYMSRPLAVSLLYALLVLIVVLAVSLLIPSFIYQFNELLHSLPATIDKTRPFISSFKGGDAVIDQALTTIRTNADSISNNILQTTFGIFGGLATAVTGLVLSFYLLLEEDNAKEFFHQILPQHRYKAVYHTVSKISDRMGSWVRGQLLLMAIIGVANLVVYLVIQLPSPLPLAVWAGLAEIIPFIGPVLGVLPALVIALLVGTPLQAALVVIVGFFLIQQLENHIVVPKVMSKAVGLSPVLVIIALVVGVKLFGLPGAILAVPVAAIISVIAGEWPELRKIWETEE